MAIDFPLSPTLGQVFTNPTNGYNYQWDGTKWVISPSVASIAAGQVLIGNTAPTATNIGDVWINTSSTPIIGNVWNGLIWERLNSGINAYGATGSEPTNAIAGDTYYNTTLSVFTVYDGATWVPYATEQFVANAVVAHKAEADPHPVYTDAVEAAAAAPLQSLVQGTGILVTNDGAKNFTAALDKAYTDTLYEPLGTANAQIAALTISTFVGSLPVAATDASAAALGIQIGQLYAVSPGTLSSHVRVRLT
jgi:hypothetical protein